MMLIKMDYQFVCLHRFIHINGISAKVYATYINGILHGPAGVLTWRTDHPHRNYVSLYISRGRAVGCYAVGNNVQKIDELLDVPAGDLTLWLAGLCVNNTYPFNVQLLGPWAKVSRDIHLGSRPPIYCRIPSAMYKPFQVVFNTRDYIPVPFDEPCKSFTDVSFICNSTPITKTSFAMSYLHVNIITKSTNCEDYETLRSYFLFRSHDELQNGRWVTVLRHPLLWLIRNCPNTILIELDIVNEHIKQMYFVTREDDEDKAKFHTMVLHKPLYVDCGRGKIYIMERIISHILPRINHKWHRIDSFLHWGQNKASFIRYYKSRSLWH